MSDNREILRVFHQNLRLLHQPFSIASDLLDISTPHEHADICCQVRKLVAEYSVLPLPV